MVDAIHQTRNVELIASWFDGLTPADSRRSLIGNPGENAHAKFTCGCNATKSNVEKTVIAIATTNPMAMDLSITYTTTQSGMIFMRLIVDDPTYGVRFRRIARAGAPSCPPTLIGNTIRS